MRPTRSCKKPRLDGGSNEEDEEVKRIKELVKELPCYQGDALDALAGKPVGVDEDGGKLEEERRQLLEERKQLKEEMNKVETMKTKVEEGMAKLEKEKAEMQKLFGELERVVECPVCLTTPRDEVPVPCCPQGHLVCSKCFGYITRCVREAII